MEVKVKGMKGVLGIASARSEGLPEAIDRLGLDKYFEEIINHSSIGAIRPNSLYVMCNLQQPTPVRITGESSFVVDSDLLSICEVFFDGKGAVFAAMRNKSESGSPVTVISVNDRTAGIFFSTLRTLFLTDWTHSLATIEVFTKIWPQMVEEFGIKPLQQRKKKGKKKVTVTIGADPEFEMVNRKGAVISASSHYDSEIFGNEGPFGNKIGLDGAGSQIELRPEPSEKPHEVVKRLKGLFQEFNAHYQNMHLGVAGDTYPLGGHIHIGVGQEFIPPGGLIRMLDVFIGRPLMVQSGRARGSYCHESSYERKYYGFEYRTPPASYLLKPEITRIVFKIAKNITEHFINKDNVIYNDPPQKEDYLKLAKLSESEYRKLDEFIASYPALPKIATAFWTKQKLPKRSPVHIELNDEWRTSNANNLTSAINRSFEKSRNKPPFPVVLYGLSKERGLVATIKIPEIAMVPEEDMNQLTVGFVRGRYWIGLPYVLRMTDYYISREQSIVSSIVAEIKRAVKIYKDNAEVLF